MNLALVSQEPLRMDLRDAAVRSIVQFLGRLEGSRVCRRWAAAVRTTPLRAEEETHLVRAIVRDHASRNRRDLLAERRGDPRLLTNLRYYSLLAVDLDDLDNVTTAAVEAFAAGCPLMRRIRIDESFVEENYARITPGAVFALAYNCSNLREVSFLDCKDISDLSVVRLARSCPQLTACNLEGCEDITDSAVLALSRHGRIVTLSIAGCLNVSPLGINAMARCRDLRSIDLFGLFQVGDR